LAALVALRVISPNVATMERLQGWATSIRQSDQLYEKVILSLLLEVDLTETK